MELPRRRSSHPAATAAVVPLVPGVDTLGREITAAVTDPVIKAHLADLSIVPAPMTAIEFRKLAGAKTEKWGKGIRAGTA
jgi:hypothetical protein